MIDLHVHTTASDGTYTPSEVVKLAKQMDLSAIAITDHDTADGLKEAVRVGLSEGLEVIPGIEISTARYGKDIHILGYFINYEADGFEEDLSSLKDERDRRNRKMADRLTEGGLPVDFEELSSMYPGIHLTRPHFASYMMQKGYVKSVAEAFDRYIGDNCPYFVARDTVSPETAIRLIRKYGGVPVLAHPYQYGYGQGELRKLIAELKEYGLLGMECFYSKYSPSEAASLVQLAKEFELLVTGGSDFHGTNRPGTYLGVGSGQKKIQDSVLRTLKKEYFKTSDSSLLFFTDLDGTLLTKEKLISPKTMEMLEAFTEAGNILVLCSGRSLYDVTDVYHSLGIASMKNVYLCGYNGAALYDCSADRLLFREGISYPAVTRIMELADSYGIYCQTYNRTGIITPRITETTDYYTRWHKMEVTESPDVTAVMTETPCKCIAIELEDHETLGKLKDALERELSDEVTAFYSNPNYVEIVDKHVSKGAALRRLAGMLGIRPENTIAAGDSENDVSMLKEAALGIVMCNGIKDLPGLKDVADIITTEDNDHDGLVPILTACMKKGSAI